MEAVSSTSATARGSVHWDRAISTDLRKESCSQPKGRTESRRMDEINNSPHGSLSC